MGVIRKSFSKKMRCIHGFGLETFIWLKKHAISKRHLGRITNFMFVWLLKKENASHIFFKCTTIVVLWNEILRWLNLSTVLHSSTMSNFIQFKGLIDDKKVLREWFIVIRFVCIWIIWWGCNKKIFINKEDCKNLAWRHWIYMNHWICRSHVQNKCQ
jgi:hypothetical protein